MLRCEMSSNGVRCETNEIPFNRTGLRDISGPFRPKTVTNKLDFVSAER